MEEDDDWSDSWRIHEHTKRLRKDAIAARDNALSHLMDKASVSADADLRAAYTLYTEAVRTAHMLEKGKWP